MKKIILLLLIIVTLSIGVKAQGAVFGVKGGLTVGVQQWNSFQRDPLLAWHGDVYTESLPEQGKFSVYASLGYHLKGSALQSRRFINPIVGGMDRVPGQSFKFNNLALTLGAKQRFTELGQNKAYYLLGIRGEYTLSTNLEDYERFNQTYRISAIYPIDQFVRRINYGVTLGAGLEWMFSELIGATLEASIQPDFSLQYEQPAIPNVRDPYTGQNRTIGERKIRNLAFEISLGLRFLRKVEYID